MNECFLDETFKRVWHGRHPFDAVSAIEGQLFRNVKTRKTFRFELENRAYFAKVHHGVGWREIFKNLFQLKLPVLGAANEYRALRKLESLGIDTMTPCAYGSYGWNPAALRSFLVTAELADTVSLEDYCRNWDTHPPAFREKTALIARVGEMAGAMHRNGLNHRDCYICHFLLERTTAGTHSPRLHVIDLHRAQLRRRTPYRYAVKDTAGLWFSAMDAGLTRHDCLRFIRAYSGKKLREAWQHDRRFWHDVDRTARKLYRKVHGRAPVC